jgi:hypothetical protein
MLSTCSATGASYSLLAYAETGMQTILEQDFGGHLRETATAANIARRRGLKTGCSSKMEGYQTGAKTSLSLHGAMMNSVLAATEF